MKSIFEFIARDSKKYATLHVLKIKAKTKLLKKRPRLGKTVPEKGDETVRELIEGNYRIIYKIVTPKRIDILTIHHGARDLKGSEIE